MGPAEAPGVRDGMAWTYAGKGAVMRWLLLRLTAVGMRRQPEKFASQMTAGMGGPDRALLLARPELAEKTIEVFREAFRSGIAGAHHEAGLYGHPWGFRLQDIATEVHLWHGEQDSNVPVSVGRYVAEAIPNSRARFLENEGHLSLPVRCVHEYLSILVA